MHAGSIFGLHLPVLAQHVVQSVRCAGVRLMMDAFSLCCKHSPQAQLLACADLLRPESNFPVATRMEGLLSELLHK